MSQSVSKSPYWSFLAKEVPSTWVCVGGGRWGEDSLAVGGEAEEGEQAETRRSLKDKKNQAHL